MKLSIIFITTTLVIAGLMKSAMADFMIFPAKGQSNEQLEQDKFSCYGWAKQQSGFDPMKAPTTSTPAPSQEKKSGGVVKGALGGAALGAIIGDSSRSARNAGAAGALIGGVRQSSANRKTQQNTEQWKQQEANKYANNRNQYNRAYSACLEGKGYTVK
ncbi:MAG: hypothetical protein KZQ64_06065 [gamma proteobacterium symbiont of Bathyaustriella thionipta]|nr:hypothetical protein [gamma proteobacterium symbiont of Bathyaustriella thionipta]MCU7949570.1 hypothetical protein [gamma proteobacterium symbiont of Bathyaustriella thionipta]MCU7952942.1 hypothetical protein [gamma proteobacterium symbiont of Bathyaustriella thionipta]MCU7956162.1 hypothetical protein [gamma proteobacterium symbiont of Bathyaustriella thionipta]MCU7966688.1 hypothetical protein [gamma proteobacterium symbiont of Bathyaustriella thionipta]